MMKMKQDQGCYKSMTGTPTLTIREEQKQKMLVWHSLLEAEYAGSRITLSFDDYVVEINGKCLDELWESIQLQDVLWVQEQGAVRTELEDDCVIEKIVILGRGQESEVA